MRCYVKINNISKPIKPSPNIKLVIKLQMFIQIEIVV